MAERQTPLLRVRDLKVAFDLPEGELVAVNGVSFQVRSGSTVALVGESGSGKSVVSQSIMGLLPKIAGIKARDEGLEVRGSVLASDAFFPFRDGIDAAAGVGVSAVIEPGGSVRDGEVIAAADEHGMAMVFTRMRHFRH